jgi:hypothetical protein
MDHSFQAPEELKSPRNSISMTFLRRMVNKKRINTFRAGAPLTKAWEFRREDVYHSLIDTQSHAAYTLKKLAISAHGSINSINHPGGEPSGKMHLIRTGGPVSGFLPDAIESAGVGIVRRAD